MVTVNLRDGRSAHSLEHALKKLKQKAAREGLTREVRRRRYATTKGEERRIKHQRELRRRAKGKAKRQKIAEQKRQRSR